MPRIEWPLSAEELVKLGYRYSRAKICKAGECGKPLLMAWTPHGALMPMVEVERPLTASEGRYFQPHFIDCPGAKKFRRSKRKRRDLRND